MHLRLTVSLVPWSAIFVLLACGPEKSESDGSTADVTGATTGTTSDTPTGPTEVTMGTGTGTTGDAGQPLLCNGEPENTPACVEICIRDTVPDTAVVEPNCAVIETRADMSSVEVPKCVEVMLQWQPPAGAEVCFAVLIDRDGKLTPSSIDDMSPECFDAGHNAEIRLVRSAPAMDGACATVTCEPSTDIMRDCPNL